MYFLGAFLQYKAVYLPVLYVFEAFLLGEATLCCYIGGADFRIFMDFLMNCIIITDLHYYYI